MQESIIIRNFGPVKDMEIQNITPFTVFIGESGSGKSTIMKLKFPTIHKLTDSI
ncbi:MAG: ATP-binding protein [Prevotellaceae bacterium]|nr:ATP-binding protein [Prevotellaceae bacterium]